MFQRKAQIWISILSIVGVILAIFLKDGIVSTILVLACALTAWGILYKNLAKLTNISDDNPKLKPVKAISIFTVAYIASILVVAFVVTQMAEKGVEFNLSESTVKLLMASLFAVPIAFFGNIAPQIPFNRYTGLRLPWTVRDEETWIVAHRVIGYISIPFAIIMFVHVPTRMPEEIFVKYWLLGVFFLWIGIPSVLSGIFFYKKWHPNR